MATCTRSRFPRSDTLIHSELPNTPDTEQTIEEGNSRNQFLIKIFMTAVAESSAGDASFSGRRNCA